MPSDFADIIELWPSAVRFAEDVGVSPITARAWKTRGIPGGYWTTVAAAAQRRGYAIVTVDLLARLGAVEAHHTGAPAVMGNGHG